MNKLILTTFLLVGLPIFGLTQHRVILDTDPSYDPDDVGCMAMLHTMASLGECEILAVVNSTDHKESSLCISAINHFYNRKTIPVGDYKGYEKKIDAPEDVYNYHIAKNYPRELKSWEESLDAVALYREILASAGDTSITVIITGTMHNFYGLLQSKPDIFSNKTGIELVKEKVKLVATMGGNFIDGKGYDRTNWGGADALCDYTSWSCINEERNAMCRYVIEHCPAPFIASGWEVGCGDYHDANYGNVMTGQGLKGLDTNHIARRSYEYHFDFRGGADDISRHSNDQCALHYAIRGEGENYTAYTNGDINLSKNGVCTWTDTQNNQQGYIQKKRDKDLIAAEVESLMLGEVITADYSPPGSPRNLTCSISDKDFTLHWEAATDTTKGSWVVAYKIYKNGKYSGTSYGLKYTETALPLKKTRYTVKAVNVNGLESEGVSLNYPDWFYISIDSSKKKWGDWNEPDWLRYFGLDFGDVNRDGFTDVVSGRYVYHNPGGRMEGEWERTTLDDNVDAIFTLDVDGDVYADIIAQALPNLYWYEAIDTKGTVYHRKTIAQIPATSHVNSQGFEKAQILPGRKLELLIAGNGNVYCISIPKDVQNSATWPTFLIAENTSDEGIGVGDIDGDGDLDISCGRRAQGKEEPRILMWFENPGNLETAWKDHIVGYTEHPIDRIEIADLNGDGQNEIVLAEERYPGLEADCHLYWFSKKGRTWEKHLIVQQYSSNNLDVADMDGDGDQDIITGEHKGPNLELQLWENDGKANFTKRILDRGKENHLGTKLIDLEGDGDLDIIGAAWDNYKWMHLWRNDKINVAVKIFLTDYETRPHYLIKTDKATYYYDIQGGGFSRIIDEYGNDWVAFKREPWGQYPASAASAFRGLPNLVYQGEDDGAGHPGHSKCKSWIKGNKIFTETKNGKWRWTWEFFKDHAVLDILSTDTEKPYWFLYEGTPGGKYQPEDSYFGTSKGGPLQTLQDYFKGTILTDQFQWMYAGSNNTPNVFYMVQVQKDDKTDMISYLGNSEAGLASKDGMTVWGFGREKEAKPLLSGQNRFVIGFYPQKITDATQHQQLAAFIAEKYINDK